MAERRVDCKQRLGFRKGATSHTHHCETSPVEAFGVRWQSEAATALWLGDPLSKAASRCACRRSPYRRGGCVCRVASGLPRFDFEVSSFEWSGPHEIRNAEP